jgi:hypothetical protein
MLSSQLRSAARLRFVPATGLTTLSRGRLAAGNCRTYLQPHTKLHERVASLQSRAVHIRPTSSSPAPQRSAGTQKASQDGPDSTVLQSAFPKKTFVFLILLTGLAYYLLDVRDLDWTDDVMNSFEQDQNQATPLQFFANKEELDHFLQHHIPDPSAPLKSPEVAKFFSEQFERLAGGWKMTEKDALEENIPVTHGCRFKSNEPCVSHDSLQLAVTLCCGRCS